MPKGNHQKKNTKTKTAIVSAKGNAGQSAKRYLTDEEKAWIIRERLARRPVIVFRYSNGKWNRRLILMLILMTVTLGAAIYFLSRY